jgi:hypothetical protein
MQSNLKKLLPFVLPLIALILIIIIVSRWYRGQTNNSIATPEYTEGLEIENLSQSELEALENIKQGLGDYQKVDFTGVYTGEVRYEVKEDRLFLSITANLPETAAAYTLWLTSGATTTRSNDLTLSKTGYHTALVTTIDKLPLTLIISEDTANAATPSKELLRATVPAI